MRRLARSGAKGGCRRREKMGSSKIRQLGRLRLESTKLPRQAVHGSACLQSSFDKTPSVESCRFALREVFRM